MNKEIQLSVPNLNIEIVENLRECIETGWVSTGGRFITEFEQSIAKYVGTQDAVSCQSGTAGLHVALDILGVKAGEEVIVPTLTFIAAVNPVRYVGASPIFMDCDEFFCMDANKLEEFCSQECHIIDGKLINKKNNNHVTAIIVVHVFGNMANMAAIMGIAKKYRLKVIEDATEALGSYYTEGEYKGYYAGTIGDIGVYSFNANKIITTGGGGMIISKKQEYLDKARYLTITAKNDSLFFVHDEVGYNYRMLNIQAALGVSQIKELEKFITVKIKNYNKYKELLVDINGIEILPFDNDLRSNHWFYSLYVDKEKFGIDRDELMHRLISKKINCRPVWKLIHTQEPYQEFEAYKIEKAKKFEMNVLNVPCSTDLTIKDVKFICKTIKEII